MEGHRGYYRSSGGVNSGGSDVGGQSCGAGGQGRVDGKDTSDVEGGGPSDGD